MRTEEQRAIHRYVFERGSWVVGATSISCFRAAVRDARTLSGRDVDTGDLVSTVGSHAWPAALMYLVLLDQVGKVIAPTPRARSEVPFLTALEEFAPSLSEQDREMLYALRCAFAHEFALANEGRGAKVALRRHIFELYEAGERRLVVDPAEPWNGEYGKSRTGGPTKVNLTEFGTLMEELIAQVESGATDGSLVLVAGVTPEMATTRWGFQVFETPLDDS